MTVCMSNIWQFGVENIEFDDLNSNSIVSLSVSCMSFLKIDLVKKCQVINLLLFVYICIGLLCSIFVLHYNKTIHFTVI